MTSFQKTKTKWVPIGISVLQTFTSKSSSVWAVIQQINAKTTTNMFLGLWRILPQVVIVEIITARIFGITELNTNNVIKVLALAFVIWNSFQV